MWLRNCCCCRRCCLVYLISSKSPCVVSKRPFFSEVSNIVHVNSYVHASCAYIHTYIRICRPVRGRSVPPLSASPSRRPPRATGGLPHCAPRAPATLWHSGGAGLLLPEILILILVLVAHMYIYINTAHTHVCVCSRTCTHFCAHVPIRFQGTCNIHVHQSRHKHYIWHMQYS